MNGSPPLKPFSTKPNPDFRIKLNKTQSSTSSSSSYSSPTPSSSSSKEFTRQNPLFGKFRNSQLSSSTPSPSLAYSVDHLALLQPPNANLPDLHLSIPVSGPPTASGKPRMRRYHSKSRNGCQGCKETHIKCDESKPKCQNCLSRNRVCVYPEPSLLKTRKSSASKDSFKKSSSTTIRKKSSQELDKLSSSSSPSPSPTISSSSSSITSGNSNQKWSKVPLNVLLNDDPVNESIGSNKTAIKSKSTTLLPSLSSIINHPAYTPPEMKSLPSQYTTTTNLTTQFTNNSSAYHSQSNNNLLPSISIPPRHSNNNHFNLQNSFSSLHTLPPILPNNKRSTDLNHHSLTHSSSRSNELANNNLFSYHKYHHHQLTYRQYPDQQQQQQQNHQQQQQQQLQQQQYYYQNQKEYNRYSL